MNSEEAQHEAPLGTENRSTTPASDTFQAYIGSNWAERAEEIPAPREHASYAARRREALSAAHPGRLSLIHI